MSDLFNEFLMCFLSVFLAECLFLIFFEFYFIIILIFSILMVFIVIIFL